MGIGSHVMFLQWPLQEITKHPMSLFDPVHFCAEGKPQLSGIFLSTMNLYNSEIIRMK